MYGKSFFAPAGFLGIPILTSQGMEDAVSMARDNHGRPTALMMSPLSLDLLQYTMRSCQSNQTLDGTYIVRRHGRVVAWKARGMLRWKGEQPGV